MNTSAVLPSADQVLVTIGTVSSASAVGGVETQRALIRGDGSSVGFAAYDAGLVDVVAGGDLGSATPRFVVRDGDGRGEPIALPEIERRWGERLRAQMGIRQLSMAGSTQLPCDLGAPLPHDWEQGGLLQRSGFSFAELRASGLRDMSTLFQNDPRLQPSLQAQLFLCGGLGALAALPTPLSSLLPEAHGFRVAAGCAFAGLEQIHALSQAMGEKGDRLAYRLSASLNTHGPALLNALLSPAYNLTKVRKNPELLEGLIGADRVMRNVPQAPLVQSGACASALLALSDVAPQLLVGGGLTQAPKIVLWTAADAALLPDGRVIEGFGPAALMGTGKLAALNEGRAGAARRGVGAALAPFDVDASGTVIGHAGSGLLVTTLRFAVEHNLDITSLIVGLGQSGETGGKGHFAGVGFGGENALLWALRMAHRVHGYGAADFQYLSAHATGTRTNSRTDLVTVERARQAVAREQGCGRLPQMAVGASKALGDGHTMGEAGLRSAAEALYYVLGEPAVGVPSLLNLDPELADCAEAFAIRATPALGDGDGGAIAFAQGFGGYDAALALRAAHDDALRRYRFEDSRQLDAYLERRSEIRAQRVEQERAARRGRGSALALVERHRWPGLA